MELSSLIGVKGYVVTKDKKAVTFLPENCSLNSGSSHLMPMPGVSCSSVKEIEVMVSGKRMEARIMELVPFGIILYVGSANPGFFEPLYGNVLGIVVMTACMGVYIAAHVMSDRIVSIEV